MDTPAIETRNLDFSFGNDKRTISSLNIKVGQGTIYGFLGPNGSGKTTSIRLMLGLLTPSKGNVMLFGKELQKESPWIFSRLGTLVETPSLMYHARGDGCRSWRTISAQCGFEQLHRSSRIRIDRFNVAGLRN